MKDGYQTFCIKIPHDDLAKMKKFQKLMDDIHEATINDIRSISEEFEISIDAAWHIHYLRSRSWWTQQKEDYLISLAKEGRKLPNVYEDFEIEESHSLRQW